MIVHDRLGFRWRPVERLDSRDVVRREPIHVIIVKREHYCAVFVRMAETEKVSDFVDRHIQKPDSPGRCGVGPLLELIEMQRAGERRMALGQKPLVKPTS